MSRYIIIEKSVSGHCCFNYSIIDTKEGTEDYSSEEDVYWKSSIAETFSYEDTELIINALNKLEDGRASII